MRLLSLLSLIGFVAASAATAQPGPLPPISAYQVLGKLTAANMTTTADQPITLNLGSATKYILGDTVTAATSIAFIITNCTAANTTATGALYRVAAKSNPMTAVTTFATLAGAVLDTQRVGVNGVILAVTTSTIFFAMTATGTGTCDVYVTGVPLP